MAYATKCCVRNLLWGLWTKRSKGRDSPHKQVLSRTQALSGSLGHTFVQKTEDKSTSVNSCYLWCQVFSGMRWFDHYHRYSSDTDRAWSLYCDKLVCDVLSPAPPTLVQGTPLKEGDSLSGLQE